MAVRLSKAATPIPAGEPHGLSGIPCAPFAIRAMTRRLGPENELMERELVVDCALDFLHGGMIAEFQLAAEGVAEAMFGEPAGEFAGLTQQRGLVAGETIEGGAVPFAAGIDGLPSPGSRQRPMGSKRSRAKPGGSRRT